MTEDDPLKDLAASLIRAGYHFESMVAVQRATSKGEYLNRYNRGYTDLANLFETHVQSRGIELQGTIMVSPIVSATEARRIAAALKHAADTMSDFPGKRP